MSDLISRSALLAEYDKHHVGAPGGARKLIEEAPTIDAAPVVHGRWEFVDDYTGRCTNCREENGMDWEDEDNYCYNCGAKMDGKADEGRQYLKGGSKYKEPV